MDPAHRGESFSSDNKREKVDYVSITRIFQCPKCPYDTLQRPITLPCGHSVCSSCFPPDGPRGRSRPFSCPKRDCQDRDQQAVVRPSHDVTLNKITDSIHEFEDRIEEVSDCGWYHELELTAALRAIDAHIGSLIEELKEAIRPELDCMVCYSMLLDPVTTSCGHTFCRACLHQVLDHGNACPTCRQLVVPTFTTTPFATPVNKPLAQVMRRLWPDELSRRSEEYRLEQMAFGGFGTPVLVLDLTFPLPNVEHTTHVSSPHHRLLIRRCLEYGEGIFGTLLMNPTAEWGGSPYKEFGVFRRITHVEEDYADGSLFVRSITTGRFCIRRVGEVDGYKVADVEEITDVDRECEGELEAVAVARRASVLASEGAGALLPDIPRSPIISASDIDTVPTSDMLEFCIAFVRYMQTRGGDWFDECVLAHFGQCPENVDLLPWWFASVMPVSNAERICMLLTSSTRSRMALCCRWALDWEDESANEILDFFAEQPAPYRDPREAQRKAEAELAVQRRQAEQEAWLDPEILPFFE
ncbi:hypothetical protein F5Y17DRAFT_431297 [Xylariaceae sp. FL0594]|nr:hypothetical protein F5Y17DRAFT_431297 [Xylariaceae sp. FL0594]